MGDFEGEKPHDLVARAEESLALKFPPSYRRFLLDLGCGAVGGFEIYGVIHFEFDRSGVPDAVWLTLDQRRLAGLDKKYVLIGDVGDGTRYAIDTSKVDECGENPIVVLSVDGMRSELVSSNFGAFFYGVVRSEAGLL